MEVWEGEIGRKVYGARKIWLELNSRGIPVARCTVERLMRELGIRGASPGRKRPPTTLPGDPADRPSDLLERCFDAAAPNCRWVADITYVQTFSGWVYTAFVMDLFARCVLGWQVADHLRSDLALDALEMAIWVRRDEDLGGLVHHSDRGVQYTSIRYAERLAGERAVRSVGSKGDSYDNAAAEALNSLYKRELIDPRKDWQGVDDVMLAGRAAGAQLRKAAHPGQRHAGPGHLPRPARRRLRRTPAPARQHHHHRPRHPRRPTTSPPAYANPGPLANAMASQAGTAMPIPSHASPPAARPRPENA